MKTIVVADDEELNRDLIASCLRKGPWRLVLAVDGEDALQKVEAEKPDLVLLDVSMPRRNGYDVCRRVKQMPELRHTRVLFLTARVLDADYQKAIEAGAEGYMVKPFRPEDLVAKVRELLGEEESVA